MPKRSKIDALPPELREWLNAELVRRGFQNYVQLAADLNARGGDTSKSGLHRYGTNLERRLSAVRAATEAARTLAAASPDDEANLSGAVIGMIQTDIFNILVNLREAEDVDDPISRAKLLAKVAKDVATLSRADVNRKRYADEIHSKARSAADAVAKIAAKGGLTKNAVSNIRRRILGVAT